MHIMDLFNGKVGHVIQSGDEGESVTVVGEINHVDDSFYRNDVMLVIDDDGIKVEDFECDPNNLYLVESYDGYRGDGCYFGIAIKDGNLYWLDLVGEGMVHEILN